MDAIDVSFIRRYARGGGGARYERLPGLTVETLADVPAVGDRVLLPWVEDGGRWPEFKVLDRRVTYADRDGPPESVHVVVAAVDYLFADEVTT